MIDLLKHFLDLALTDAGITAIVTAGAIVLGIFLRKNQKALRTVVDLAHFAYDAVNAIKDQTQTKIDDKVALALGIIVDRLGRELTDGEKEAAQAVFDERHTVEKVAADFVGRAISKGIKIGVAK